MQKTLQSYLRKLTNLTGNNRSLLLLRLSAEQFVDIHDFDFTLGKPSFQIIAGLIAQLPKIPLCKLMDSRDSNNNKQSQNLKKLKRLDDFIFQERGGKDLYIGWPFVHGKFGDGTLVRCPLLFFPVELQEDNKTWFLAPRTDVNITLNKTFLLAYSYYNKVALDEDLVERVFDDFDKDSRVFRTSLYELLRDSKIEVNFNPENFADQLTAFAPLVKDKFDLSQGIGKLKLVPESVLGIFPQNGSYIVPDYLKLLEQSIDGTLGDFFRSKSGPAAADETSATYLNKVKEEHTYTPFEIDAYQESALRKVKEGHSIVVQGPPGTGKSQLICNLIADFIARGKKVLLVCQKRAALDVVYHRLCEKELGPFAALIHDFKNDRKTVYEQMATQVGNLDDYKLKNNSLNAIQLEREFSQVSRRIDQIVEELDEFKEQLYKDSECGKSVKQLYLTSNLAGKTISLKQEYKFFTFEKVDEFLRKLSYYVKYSSKFKKDGYLWADRVSFSHFGVAELGRLIELVDEVLKFNQAIVTKSKEVLGGALSFEECQDMLERRPQVKEMFALINDKAVYEKFVHMSGFPDGETDALWLANNERILMECYKGKGPELTTASSDLGRLQEAIERGRKARRGPFSWFRWRFFSKDKVFISRVLVANNLTSNTKGFEELMVMVDSRLNLEHNLTKLRSAEWIPNPPDAMPKTELQNWFFYHKRALNAKLIFSALRPVAKIINPKTYTYDELKALTDKSFAALGDIPVKWEQWIGYFTPRQLKHIMTVEGHGKQLVTVLKMDFDSLVEYDKLQSDFLHYERQILDRLQEQSPDWNLAEWIDIFENSLRLHWIDHIETKYPVLRGVSSLRIETLTAELSEAVRTKSRLSAEILLLRLRENTFAEMEYNRLNKVVTYRELYHQVTKKKRIWPIRRLLAHSSAEAFRLVPCWLTSPEAASAIFQLDEKFDLVIFDEASQCFVENALPAIYRGQQVVITGDDKQLKPNDLYRIRWESAEEEEDSALEVDSLLDLSMQFLGSMALQGHYRSRSLDLIEFSNQHFYNGKLHLVPHHQVVNETQPGISYYKVDGIWENNRNELEARKVVELTVDMLRQFPEKEIGIVTFNVYQQQYIMDLLDEYQTDNNLVFPPSLIVKNIENMQGDEKDFVIFTIGYAPDKKGKLQMKFGSLNMEGGENRLNVAVTRARDKVVVVSSLLPHQLEVDGSKNEGPKLLRKYLEYAWDVSGGRFKPGLTGLGAFGRDWYLKNRLIGLVRASEKLKGYKVSQEFSFSDLAVAKEKEILGLIYTDDDIYFESQSAKQSHVYREQMLEKKGWKSRVFYSREFWQNPEGVEENLLKFIGQLGQP